ncbi:MAG: TonB-dependent receptor [Bacteroidetes bacterium]|nr:TonB-dependent receptor [Bacteroidota bacterium]
MRIKVLPNARRIIFMMIAVLIPSLTFAQSYTLTGIVKDDMSAPLAGTTIIKAGNSGEGTITGADGSYELPVAKGDVLTFSFIGYIDKSITISGQSKLDVQMVADATKLDDVVVVGYGRMRKADVTAAITSVDVDELKTVATSDPMAALQGRVSGVNIQKTSGLAGSGVSVKIRGINTFGGNAPLYIIDGFKSDISSVSPTDIESLQILKDGAAAAIYGSEAANGVVIITTKSGKKGKVVIDFNSYISYQQIAKQLDFLDTKGYQKLENLRATNDGKDPMESIVAPTDVDTDWQDEVYRNGFAQSYGISISGGTEDMKVVAGANFTDQLGMTIGNRYDRQDAFVKAQIKKHALTFDAKIAYNGYKRTDAMYSLTDTYKMASIVPVYSDEKETGDGFSRYGQSKDLMGISIKNPVAMHENESYTEFKNAIQADAALTIDFTDWLSFKSGYSFATDIYRGNGYAKPYRKSSTETQEFSYVYDSRSQEIRQTINEVLTFDKKFGKHSFNFLLGLQLDLQENNWARANVDGYVTDDEGNKVAAGFQNTDFTTLDAGKGGSFTGNGSYNEYNRVSYFSRLNYNYDNRYLIQATVRRDASSKFGENNRWGTFPSVAVGWRITQENFFPEDTVIDDLKLRLSYGTLGNENVLSSYAYEALMQKQLGSYAHVFGGAPILGMSSFDIDNKDLKWETTESINFGLDYALLDNRLSGTLNYYQTTTKDLLTYKEFPYSAGLNSTLLNVGKVRNNGFEFELRWAETKGDWDYNVGLIVSTTHNEVLKLGSKNISGSALANGGVHIPTSTEVGHAIGAFKLYETAGLFQTDDEAKNYTFTDKEGNISRIQPKAEAGDVKFVDVNNDGVLDEKDKTFQGSGIPKAEVSLSMGFAWKGIDFNALIGSGWGHKLYNGNMFQYGQMNERINQLAFTLDSWTPENTNTNVPKATINNYNDNNRESDRYLENGDFIRLRQIQIGYTLPISATQKISIDKVRFYVSGENLFTWTNYSGIDPEFSRSSLTNAGVDRLIYPFTKSYVFGVQVTF